MQQQQQQQLVIQLRSGDAFTVAPPGRQLGAYYSTFVGTLPQSEALRRPSQSLRVCFVPSTRFFGMQDDFDGIFRKRSTLEARIVSISVDPAAAPSWWRVVPSFTSWSRAAMKHRRNLLHCLPCELCWLTLEARSFFVNVYGDAFILPHLRSADLRLRMV